MKKGDLVNFHSNAWVFESASKDYKNPGIVLDIKTKYYKLQKCDPRISAQVLWADGKITTEHECYLQICDDNTYNMQGRKAR